MFENLLFFLFKYCKKIIEQTLHKQVNPWPFLKKSKKANTFVVVVVVVDIIQIRSVLPTKKKEAKILHTTFALHSQLLRARRK